MHTFGEIMSERKRRHQMIITRKQSKEHSLHTKPVNPQSTIPRSKFIAPATSGKRNYNLVVSNAI